MEKERMFPTSVRLPESIKNELERIADRDTRSMSNVILLACKEYIKNHQDE